MKSVCVEKQLFIALEITTTYLTMNEYKDPIREIGVYSDNFNGKYLKTVNTWILIMLKPKNMKSLTNIWHILLFRPASKIMKKK